MQLYTRKWYWYFKVPLESAINWNCKYKITASQELISKHPKGYVMVQTEMYGSDEEVNIII